MEKFGKSLELRKKKVWKKFGTSLKKFGNSLEIVWIWEKFENSLGKFGFWEKFEKSLKKFGKSLEAF